MCVKSKDEHKNDRKNKTYVLKHGAARKAITIEINGTNVLH